MADRTFVRALPLLAVFVTLLGAGWADAQEGWDVREVPLEVRQSLPAVEVDLDGALPGLRAERLADNDRLFIMAAQGLALEQDKQHGEWQRSIGRDGGLRWQADAAGRSQVRLPLTLVALPVDSLVIVGVERPLQDGWTVRVSRTVNLRANGQAELGPQLETRSRPMVRLSLVAGAPLPEGLPQPDAGGRISLPQDDPGLARLADWIAGEEPNLSVRVRRLSAGKILDSVTGWSPNNVDIVKKCENYSAETIAIGSAPVGATITSMDVSYDVYHEVDIARFKVALFRQLQTSTIKVLYYGDSSGDNWLNRSHSNLSDYNGYEVNSTYNLGVCNRFLASEVGHLDYWEITLYYGAPGAIDLQADSITPSASSIEAGASFTVNSSGQVTGTGTVSSSFVLGYYLSSDNNITTGDTSLGTQTVNNATDPGDTFGASGKSLTIPGGTTPGTYYVGMIVDVNDSVTESDANNNTVASQITVQQPSVSEPNLLALPCSVSPATVAPGDQVTFSWRGRNSGSAASGAFRRGYYLSNNSSIDPAADQVLGTNNVANWVAGKDTGTLTRTLTIPAGTSEGQRYLGMFLDDQYAVDESDESDNTCAVAVTVDTPGACSSSSTDLCLQSGRFEVTVEYETQQGSTGSGKMVALTDETGYFWFFSQDNVEIVIKVLNGCGINGHYWVFAAGLTNVEVTLTVVDTESTQTKTYTNPQGQAFQTILDTAAFSACP